MVCKPGFLPTGRRRVKCRFTTAKGYYWKQQFGICETCTEPGFEKSSNYFYASIKFWFIVHENAPLGSAITNLHSQRDLAVSYLIKKVSLFSNPDRARSLALNETEFFRVQYRYPKNKNQM